MIMKINMVVKDNASLAKIQQQVQKWRGKLNKVIFAAGQTFWWS